MKDNTTIPVLSSEKTAQSGPNAIKWLKKLYVVDLIIRLCKARNIPALLYLILNIVIISGVFYYVSDSVSGIFIGLFIYIFCVFIALSPFGEWIARLTHGCKKIKDKELLSRLEPLFNEVYSRAINKQTAYNISSNIKLYICDDKEANAFALGRRTICITTGLLQLPDVQIKGIIGHEMGHLANHDTDLVMLITVGNFLVSSIVLVIKLIILLFRIVPSLIGFIVGDYGFHFATAVTSILTIIFINTILWIWTKIGVLLVMKSSRKQEYAADCFSCELGYAYPLLAFFKEMDSVAATQKVGFFAMLSKKLNLFALLNSSHPPMKKRIAAIDATLRTVLTK